MPPKSSTSSRKQSGQSKSKKGSNPIPSYESVQKTVKDSKKSMPSQKTLLTTTMEMCAVERSSSQHLLWRCMKEPKTRSYIVMDEARTMRWALWIPTSIKPSPVHRLNAPLPLLPCSLHRSASPRNVGSLQHLLSMLPFCATMILCELNI
jgi:hypothetical protein